MERSLARRCVRLAWLALAFYATACESSDDDGAGGTGGGSSASVWDGMQDALVACGIWEKGDLTASFDSDEGRCVAGCFGRHADCATATTYSCEGRSAIEGSDTALARCIGDCENFTCANGTVTGVFNLCDGQDDCGDGSDERGCPEKMTFRCNDGAEVPITDRCNLEVDCGMLEDEMDCPTDAFFHCDNGFEYYPSGWECDLHKDCSDGSDEGPHCAHLVCPPPPP